MKTEITACGSALSRRRRGGVIPGCPGQPPARRCPDACSVHLSLPSATPTAGAGAAKHTPPARPTTRQGGEVERDKTQAWGQVTCQRLGAILADVVAADVQQLERLVVLDGRGNLREARHGTASHTLREDPAHRGMSRRRHLVCTRSAGTALAGPGAQTGPASMRGGPARRLAQGRRPGAWTPCPTSPSPPPHTSTNAATHVHAHTTSSLTPTWKAPSLPTSFMLMLTSVIWEEPRSRSASAAAPSLPMLLLPKSTALSSAGPAGGGVWGGGEGGGLHGRRQPWCCPTPHCRDAWRAQGCGKRMKKAPLAQEPGLLPGHAPAPPPAAVGRLGSAMARERARRASPGPHRHGP